MDGIISTILTVIASAFVGGAITYVVGVAKVKYRVVDLEKWRCYIQEDNDNGIEERGLLLSGLLACLKGLQELECDGPVSHGIEVLETYINDKAHKPRSFTKEQQKAG